MRFLTRTGVLALACAALVAGCGGGDDSSADQTTPIQVRDAVFSRSFSECGSEPLENLAGKHNVSANSAAVSTAVGQFWADRFGGHEDAAREGKLGCLQSLSLENLPGQTKKKSKPKTSTQP